MRHLVCTKVGATDMPERRHTFGTVRHSFVVFSPAWVAAVQSLAEGAPKPDGEIALDTGVPRGVEGQKNSQEIRLPRLESEVLVAQGLTSDGEI